DHRGRPGRPPLGDPRLQRAPRRGGQRGPYAAAVRPGAARTPGRRGAGGAGGPVARLRTADRAPTGEGSMGFDATGKVAFDHIYDRDDPRPYFAALQALDYCIPQEAKPYFIKLIQDYRAAEGVVVPTVLDIGCSYGINAALLHCDATI